MTFNSVFGASIAAAALGGAFLFHTLAPAPAHSNAAAAGTQFVSAADRSANIVFDQEGRAVGRSIEVVSSENGQLVAVMERSAAEKNVVMKRGKDGVLRLVAE